MQLLALGYYGFGNFGDELILTALQEELSGLDCEVAFAVNDPGQYGPPHSPQYSLVDRHDKRAMLHALSRADLVLLGGGGLVQDTTSWRSSLYYLGIPLLASFRHKCLAAYAQGIGPLTRRWSRQLTRTVFARMRLIDVRDQTSQDLLVQCGLQSSKIHVSADLALPYLLRHRPACRSCRQRGIVACVNPSFGWSPEDAATFLETLTSQTGEQIILAVLFPASDLEFSKAVRGHLQVPCELVESPAPEDLLQLCSAARITVAGRYHMAVAGMAAQSPVIALAYDPKITQLSNAYHIPAVQPGVVPQQAVAALPVAQLRPVPEELLDLSLQVQTERIALLRSLLAT